jgi:N-terminal region of glycosyl transferase group 7/N-terminal domain of galactosyltransferase
MSDSFESEVHEDVPDEILDTHVESEISVDEVSGAILSEIIAELQENGEEEVPPEIKDDIIAEVYAELRDVKVIQEKEIKEEEVLQEEEIKEEISQEEEIKEEIPQEEGIKEEIPQEEEIKEEEIKEEIPQEEGIKEDEIKEDEIKEEIPQEDEIKEESEMQENIPTEEETIVEPEVLQNMDITNTDSNSESENQPPSIESIEDPQYYSTTESSSIESNNTQSTFNSMEPASVENIQFKLEEVYEQTDNFIHIENIPIEVPNQHIPTIVFIVPYRNRENDKRFFDLHMKKILEDYDPCSYRIFYIHQQDDRNFNRGAMKNIGFLYCKELYPNDYQNITLVFNDVDTMPSRKGLFKYETEEGTIKHFYGHTHTLGGIFSIKGCDFEKVQGFPNFWAWGYEDNAIYRRATLANIAVDRSEFYNIQDKNVIHLSSGTIRQTNRIEFDRYLKELNENKIVDGYSTISQLTYDFDYSTNMLNVSNFVTTYIQQEQYNTLYDIKNGSQPYKSKSSSKRATGKHLGFFM